MASAETPEVDRRQPQIPQNLEAMLTAQPGGLPYLGQPPIGTPGFSPPGGLMPRGMTVMIQSQLWQGQFPPPDVIERYEKVLPGAFDRILKMAEKLQEAQFQEIERAQDYTQKDTARGHRLGVYSIIVSVVAATVCVSIGAYTDTSGSFIVAAALVGFPLMGTIKALIDSAKTPSPKDFIKSQNEQPSTAPQRKLS